MVSVKERMENVIDEMVKNGVRLSEAVRDFEKKYIAAAVHQTRGSQRDAARILGIHRNTVAKKMNGSRPPRPTAKKKRRKK
jgi:DNA-binding NtrC family response regulator